MALGGVTFMLRDVDRIYLLLFSAFRSPIRESLKAKRTEMTTMWRSKTPKKTAWTFSQLVLCFHK